jgi:hemolysin activation/secretion protein
MASPGRSQQTRRWRSSNSELPSRFAGTKKDGEDGMPLCDAGSSIGLSLGLLAMLPCQAQTSLPVVRLPQDTAREPQPSPRDVPLLIDRDRFAEQVPARADAITLRLNGIELSGNTVIATERLEPLWAAMVGRDIPLSAVFELAARISSAYREAGYVLSQALVPQQQIDQSGGRVRIRVAEGYVSRITIADGVPGAARIARMLEPVRAERPLTLATLERHLLLLGDLPGVSAQASLRAAQEENAAELELVVTRQPQAFSVSVHNRTATAVGPIRIEASAERRGALGDFDRHVLRWVGSGTDRLNLVAYNGDTPLGDRGATLSWSASASRSKPKEGDVFRFDTRADSVSLGLGYPVLRTRSANFSVRGALSGYNGSSDIVDGLTVSKERIRPLRIGFNADLADELGGVNLVDVEVARGLSGFGASRSDDPELPRGGSNPRFTKLTLYAARLQSLSGEWSLLAAITAQTTHDLLTSSEQFGLGGDVFLRAYDPSELLGDRGQAGKLELRYNASFSAINATAYAFYEGGSVRTFNVDAPTSRQSAASCGLGMRFSAQRGVRGYMEIAKPVNRPTVRHGDERARVFAGIGIDL